MAFNSCYLTGTCSEVNLHTNLTRVLLKRRTIIQIFFRFLRKPLYNIKMLLELKVYMDSVWRKCNHSYNGIGLNREIFAVTMVLFYEAFIFTFQTLLIKQRGSF